MVKIDLILTVIIVCLVLWDVHITTAQDTIEMPQMIYEATLPAALYPGNILDIKLHLRPGVKWFRLNLQERDGDPTSVAIETAMAIRVTVDSMVGQVERDWYSAVTKQLASPENSVYGQLKFRENKVFVISLLCMIDTYEVQVNGYQKFTFQHRSAAALTTFNAIRIMAEVGSVEVCWIKSNLEILSSATAAPGGTPCDQQVQTSLCDELVCYLFSDEHLMYASTPMPIPTTTQTLSKDVVSSLEDMTERICCLDGLTDDIATNGDRSSLQLAANITSELLTWNRNASWNTINQLSNNGPISVLDRLDDVAQVIGAQLEVGEVLRANTSTLSCILESNTLEEFIKTDWTFKPFPNSEEQIIIKRSDLIGMGHNNDNKISILGVVHTNITEIFNNHQKGTKDYISADVISATVFTPTGRFSIPASFKRQITNLAGSVNASTERVSFCGFWDDYLNDTKPSGGWSTAGCQRVDVVDEEFIEDDLGDFVSCYCNHTTNYAILMRIVPIRVRRRVQRKTTTSKPTKMLIKHTTTLPTTTSPKPTSPTVTTPEPTTEPTTKPTTKSTAKSTTQPTTKSTTRPTTKSTTRPTTKSTTQPTTKRDSNILEATTQIIIETFTKRVKGTTGSRSVETLKPTEPHLVTTDPVVNCKPSSRECSTLQTVHDTTSAKPEAPASKPRETVSSSAEAATGTSFNPTDRITHDVISTNNQSATSNNVSAINDTTADYYYYYYYYPVDPVSARILDVLTLIGCITSIIALTVALICFIAFR